jgi:hypothetical protein
MNNGRRQPSRGGTSRMNREVHVRNLWRLGVKFPGPTRQSRRLSCLGMSASPPTPDVWLRSSERTLRVEILCRRGGRGDTGSV